MAQWREESLQEGDGIIVGVDCNLEWALPWWWLYYSSHNTYPVTFVDFGMTGRAKQWCSERGELRALAISNDFVLPMDKIAPDLALRWKKEITGHWWECRTGWFKKPLALLHTPYQRTIWIDIDCEVRGELSPIFTFCHNPAGLAVTPVSESAHEDLLKIQLRHPDEVIYSSGLVVYERHSPIIEEWAERALTQNAEFFGDQDLLSRILYERKTPFSPLPEMYHHIALDDRLDTLVKHWGGGRGKVHILEMMRKLSALFPGILDLVSILFPDALDLTEN